MILTLILAIVTIPPVPMDRFPQWQWAYENGDVIELAQPPVGSVIWEDDPTNCESAFSDTINNGDPIANRCEGLI